MDDFSIVRWVGIAASALAILGIVAVRFVVRDRLSRGTYHLLLMAVLFALPAAAVLATVETVFGETKRTEACASCHVMEPFVDDMRDPGSRTLAAAHYRNGWIPRDHCYGCHVTYGATGTVDGKRDGLRHWLLYVTGTYEEPIHYTGSYPNANCLGCHDGAPRFSRVLSHQALDSHLRSDGMACASCHGPPHPPSPERQHAER